MVDLKDISKKDRLIMGVSGGADSVFLLLYLFKRGYKNLIIAHVNHQTRGKENEKDAIFVHNLSKKLNLPFEEIIIEKHKKGNAEDYFRNKRYEFFEELRQKYKANWIITAHHLNDNIETILLNFTRGANISGLTGIHFKDENRHIIRPLLNISRDEIEKQLKNWKQKFRVDSSNYNIDHSRNRIRQNVIPELKKINPNLEKTLKENIENLKETANFIKNKTDSWIKTNYKNNQFEINKFLNQALTIQNSILSRIFKKIHGNTNKFNQNHLKQIRKILEQNISNKKKEFGPGHFIEIRKDKDAKVARISLKNK
ncbi:tRNA lysidine(34) synthetase TilS [Candidatus Peregrinibacteria bacterium]|nr:tRNA lysidine(34) synthetase TilS [Candidatus Peregrinibacteria bacterium]